METGDLWIIRPPEEDEAHGMKVHIWVNKRGPQPLRAGEAIRISDVVGTVRVKGEIVGEDPSWTDLWRDEVELIVPYRKTVAVRCTVRKARSRPNGTQYSSYLLFSVDVTDLIR